MPQRTQTPRDLADRLYQSLIASGRAPPALDHLNCLLEVSFFASMQTEESQPIRCTLAFVDPAAPDPQRPDRVRPQRWTVTRFETPALLSVSSLTKLAPAAPPEGSAIAVFIDPSGEPIAWGLVDQALHDAHVRSYQAPRTFERPGLFQIELSGVGEISVYHSHQLLATLRKNELLNDAFVVFRSGPIREKLLGYVTMHEKELEKIGIERGLYGSIVEDTWMSTLSRVLNGIKRYHRGGAMLFVPSVLANSAQSELNAKFSISYHRLAESVSMSAQCQYLHWCATESIEEQYQLHDDRSGELHISYSQYNAEAVRANDSKDWLLAHDGSIAFVSALSRIDGLILMAGGLSVRAFGVEILTKPDPEIVYLAGDEEATPSRRRQTTIEHYGTRHRSMLRFCSAHPEAVGFVISHDGDIRAITRVGADVVLWENIHLYNVAASPRISAGGVPKGSR